MLDSLGWLAFLLALVPALIRLHRTRSLLPHAGDPALPERMLGSRNPIIFAFSAIATIEIFLWPRLAVITIPLLVVAFALAGWPLRRALFAETWSFPSYLWFYVRLSMAIYGFWILLIASPWLTDLEGMRGWAVAAALGIVLLAWNHGYSSVLRAVLRARPITTPALTNRFNAIVAKTSVTPPGVDYVDMRGGVLVNALALPGVNKSTVLFTSTLLDRFDEDEVEAIFAHEVAHLEHYHPGYLKRLLWIGWLLIAATVAIRPLLQTVAPAYESWVLAWPFVVLIYLIALGNKKQQHETESDLRSAALTGNPEVMIRALIKLHEMMKLPRRLDPSVEVSASHPSLARRIQAIRAASGATAAPLPESIVLSHESTTVTLNSDRLVWSEGELSSYTLAYSALDELRIEADGKGSTRLIASDPAGRKWAMPLAAADVPRAQAALNVVDLRLRATPAGAGRPAALGRFVVLIGALTAIAALQAATTIVAVLAAFSFERPLVRAAGVASITGGLLALGTLRASPMAWMLIAIGGVLLLLDCRDKRELVSRTTWRIVSVLGGLALLLTARLALAGGDLLALHQAARNWPSLVVMSMAFAVAAMSRPKATWKAASAVAVVIAGVAVALSSTRTLDAWLDDPFLADAAVTGVAPPLSDPVAEFEIDFYPGELLLSPDGTAIAAVRNDGDHHETIHAGRAGRPLREFAGNTGLFVDEHRLLTTESRPGATVLRLVDVDTADVVWENTLDIVNASISIDRQATTWQALGVGHQYQFTAITGPIDGGDTARRDWASPGAEEESTESPLAVVGSQLLVRSMTFAGGGFHTGRFDAWTAWLDPWRTETQLLSIDEGSRQQLFYSVLDVTCLPPSFTGESPVCSAHDGSRSHIAKLNPRNGELTPLTKLGGLATFGFAREWLTGWISSTPFAWHMPTGTLFQRDRSEDQGGYRGYYVSGDAALAVVHPDERGSTIRIYRPAMR